MATLLIKHFINSCSGHKALYTKMNKYIENNEKEVKIGNYKSVKTTKINVSCWVKSQEV